MRTKVYNSIVERMADLRWHDVRELEELTTQPEDLLRELKRDPRFDVDSNEGKIRLRAGPSIYAT
jgi:hypothetical protein